MVQSTVFTRAGSPNVFDAQVVQPLKTDVNALLSTLAVNAVLDVRYDYGQLQTSPPLVYGVATVLYLV